MSDGRPFIPAWLVSLGLSHCQFRVLADLWSRGNHCYPSADTIAKDCRIKKLQTVWACLKVLEQRGLIKRSIQQRAQGRTSNTYELHLPDGWASMKRPGDKSDKRTSASNGLVPLRDSSPVPQTDLTPVPQTDRKGTPEKVHQEGLARPRAARARNPLFDALAKSCGSDPLQMTDREAKACGVALAELRAASPQLDEREIERRAQAYKRRFQGAALTPHALVSHWSELGHGTNGATANHGQDLAEPADWRSRMAEHYPNASHQDDPRPWRSLPRFIQQEVIDALAKVG